MTIGEFTIPDGAGWATVALAAIGLIGAVWVRSWARQAKREADIEALRVERRVALEHGRFTDAATASTKLRRLGALMAAGMLIAACSGCATSKRVADPVVIGERVFIPTPGQVLTVPDLIPPAKRWYLMDDVSAAELAIPQ